MSTKFVRFVAALVVVASIVGNTGVAEGAHGAPPSVNSQNQRPPRAPESRPLGIPALTVPPASSLGVQFVHVATAANIVINATIIDNPLTNGNPAAILLVTQNNNPGGVYSVGDDSPISTFYDGSNWRIFNQDTAAMPVGAAFNVIIPTAGPGVFVQTATAGNTAGISTYIDNALTNGNPNAMVFVTPRYQNSSGVCPCALNNQPIGVWYDSTASKWAIFNQDSSSGPPLNASFNVSVLTAGAGVFVHVAAAPNIVSNWTIIDNALTNGNPNAIVFVTQDPYPGGVVEQNDNHNIGVVYTGGKWSIYNQDGTTIPLNASFNVLVLVPASDIFVHMAIAANINLHTTAIDHALTNGHANAIVFTTQNYNPGGAGGMDDPHNTGVYYNGSAWAIFNQDHAAMPVNAAFNVLIPNPDTSVFVHKATVANISTYITSIDYPLANGNPNAILIVTQNWDPGGVGGQDDDHPLGVYYSAGQWTIFNQDSAVMPVGAAFNVFVPTARPGVGVFVHKATGANILAQITYIDNPLTNSNPNAIIVVTPNFNPGGVVGANNNHPIGVWYDSTTSKWAIFNQDHAAMPVNAAFNVYVVGNFKLYLPLVIR